MDVLVIKLNFLVSSFLASSYSSSKDCNNSFDPCCSFTVGSNFHLMSSIKNDFPDPHLRNNQERCHIVYKFNLEDMQSPGVQPYAQRGFAVGNHLEDCLRIVIVAKTVNTSFARIINPFHILIEKV